MALKKGYARVVFDEVAYAEDVVRSGRAVRWSSARRRRESRAKESRSARCVAVKPKGETARGSRLLQGLPALARREVRDGVLADP
jgi:hypothetical protein